MDFAYFSSFCELAISSFSLPFNVRLRIPISMAIQFIEIYVPNEEEKLSLIIYYAIHVESVYFKNRTFCFFSRELNQIDFTFYVFLRGYFSIEIRRRSKTGQYFVGRLREMILYCTRNGSPLTTTLPYEPYILSLSTL